MTEAEWRQAVEALDNWKVFREWLAKQPANAALDLPGDLDLLEYYLREHGVHDAEGQAQCGKRECRGCWVKGCKGGWQNMRWFGKSRVLSGWMFWEVLGYGVGDEPTWGEALALFDAALAEVNWYEDTEE